MDSGAGNPGRKIAYDASGWPRFDFLAPIAVSDIPEAIAIHVEAKIASIQIINY
jgi:hypothetical protein